MGAPPSTPPDFRAAPSPNSPIFWHFARRLAPWMAATAAYIVVATLVVRWDMNRTGERAVDFGEDLYGIYMQLFFEPTEALPRAPIARIVFWITPLLGVILLARGVVRVGASVFDVAERRRLWVKIMSDGMKQHVIVCGLGHVGVRVVESLRGLGTNVVAIERSAEKSFAADVERLGVPVLYGDARRDDLLIQAGIQRARAVVCATDDDLTNLELAIDARRENPEIRVVMRVFDQRVAGKIGAALDLDDTFSTAALAGPIVALQAMEDGVRAVYRLADGSLRVDLEITAPEAWWGLTVGDCEDVVDGRIIAIRRGDKPPFRARHDQPIQKNDTLALDVPAENVARLRSAGRTRAVGKPRRTAS
jgi:voltage-gated potassium channel